MRVAVLQHESFEGPAQIGTWLTRQGHVLTLHNLYLGEPLPTLADFDALLVMGGGMNVYQYRDYPFLQGETELIRSALAAGKKMIGICLGAQLMAHVMGSTVVQNREVEVGFFPVFFTPEARTVLPSLPEKAEVFHWHGDTFALPADTLRLAFSEACPEQGFLYRDQVLALQFHAELGPSEVMALADHEFAGLKPGAFVQPLENIRCHAKHAPHGPGPLLDTLLRAVVPG
ncbi:MAG: type 1 glutamine amidotransferase [Candidatus Methylacidiphilales bacterium]